MLQSLKSFFTPNIPKQQLSMREEIQLFVHFYDKQTDRPDEQINWVSLGYSLYEAYYNLLHKYPDVCQITNFNNLHQKPSERSYTWLDDKPTWYTCSQQEMEMHYERFLKISRGVHYELLSAFGTNPKFPQYGCIAYLGYAFGESAGWDNVVAFLKDWLDQEKQN